VFIYACVRLIGVFGSAMEGTNITMVVSSIRWLLESFNRKEAQEAVLQKLLASGPAAAHNTTADGVCCHQAASVHHSSRCIAAVYSDYRVYGAPCSL
jgi:hypothetical protein